MRLSRKNKRGFTLIEMLTVIAIISILLTLLSPALGRARKKARLTSYLNNLKQVGYLISLYETDFNRLPSSLNDLGGDDVDPELLAPSVGNYTYNPSATKATDRLVTYENPEFDDFDMYVRRDYTLVRDKKVSSGDDEA